MHKHFDFGYQCHIPSICKHNVVKPDKLESYTWYMRNYEKMRTDTGSQMTLSLMVRVGAAPAGRPAGLGPGSPLGLPVARTTGVGLPLPGTPSHR